MEDHYDRLVRSNSISLFEKAQQLNRYKNPSIKIYSNPQNQSQKIVYIEYEKNWWGRLYFTLFKESSILKWIPIKTHGATTKCVQWKKNGFFYEDSTHRGTKTKNTCLFQKETIHCKREEQP